MDSVLHATMVRMEDGEETRTAIETSQEVVDIVDALCVDLVTYATLHETTTTTLLTQNEPLCSAEKKAEQDYATPIPNEGCSKAATTTETSSSNPTTTHQPLLVCDLGYGLPNEARPRKEKLLAIARQLVNFLSWQQQQQDITTKSDEGSSSRRTPAHMLIVLGNSDATRKTKNHSENSGTGAIRQALTERMHEVWKQQQQSTNAFPDHVVSFTEESLEVALQVVTGHKTEQRGNSPEASTAVVYLSPDADIALDPAQAPPAVAIVGLLIDRRSIQVNRSVVRAAEVTVPAARWPLESIATLLMHKNEPLNVDCILEGMQQWYWNYSPFAPTTTAFEKAAIQAIQHHQQRHPERPRHKDI
jgi:hypothetical protein